MSTWTEVVYYIKTQLKPGVLGHTDVQKILNAILAIIQQVNAGDYSPTNAALWKADVSYSADVVPVLWQDNWLVSNTADNLGNVPISTSGVLHPSWRIIGSSPGSGIRIWEPIVYPNTLEMVFSDGALYYLNRAEVGSAPFVSVDFAGEVAGDVWVGLINNNDLKQRSGSFTPVFVNDNGDFSSTNATGSYIKTGKLVYVEIAISGIQNEGIDPHFLGIGGLPFPSSSPLGFGGIFGLIYFTGSNLTPTEVLSYRIAAYSSDLYFTNILGEAPLVTFTDGVILLSGTYQTN